MWTPEQEVCAARTANEVSSSRACPVAFIQSPVLEACSFGQLSWQAELLESACRPVLVLQAPGAVFGLCECSGPQACKVFILWVTSLAQSNKVSIYHVKKVFCSRAWWLMPWTFRLKPVASAPLYSTVKVSCMCSWHQQHALPALLLNSAVVLVLLLPSSLFFLESGFCS